VDVGTAVYSDDSEYRRALAAVVKEWRESLIDLSSRNRLLNYKPTRASSLELSTPEAEVIVSALERGVRFAPLPDADDDDDDTTRVGRRQRAITNTEILTEKSTTKALQSTLKALNRKATQIFNDYGLWTMQLGIGMLNWREDHATSGTDAPLILIPVRIQRNKRGEYLLELNVDDEPRFNPALRIKLEQMHLDWMAATPDDPTDVTGVLAATRKLVQHKPAWAVTPRVVLGIFASHKEAMYQDLLDNQAQVIASDLFGAVALGPDARIAEDRFAFDPVDLDRIDEAAPPEDTPLVLDADSSQRQAVAAAVGGNSFVLDGPPGTGKSQTITNIIAALLHSGSSVLFVSEKAAALDVVLNRMRAVGLDSYVLALHSNNTSRKAVAQELGRALMEAPTAEKMRPEALDELRTTRHSLSAYAEAMNSVRVPLESSIHDVIGRVGELATVREADHLVTAAAQRSSGRQFQLDRLDRRTLTEILDRAQAIAQTFAIVHDAEYPWKGIRQVAEGPDVVRRQAAAALERLRATVDTFAALAPEAGPTDNDAGLDRLAKLIGLLSDRHSVPEFWLTAGGFDNVVEQPVAEFRALLHDVQAARTKAQQVGGSRWEELPESLNPEKPTGERALTVLTPAGIEPADLAVPYLKELQGKFQTWIDDLESLIESTTELAESMGLTVPQTPAQARTIASLAGFAVTENAPHSAMLDPGGLVDAESAAVAVLAAALQRFSARCTEVRLAQQRAAAALGAHWTRLPASLSDTAPISEQELAGLTPTGIDLSAFTAARCAEHRQRFEVLIQRLDSAARQAEAVAMQFGIDASVTVRELGGLVELADLAQVPDRALPDWFGRGVLAQVEAAVDELTAAARELASAEADASKEFAAELVASQEAAAAIERLQAASPGLGGTFSKQVRADRKTIGALTTTGTWRKDLHEHLAAALRWHTAYATFHTTAAGHEGLLGRYVADGRPDVAGVQAALAQAHRVIELAGIGADDERARKLLSATVSDGVLTDADLAVRRADIVAGLHAWDSESTRAPLAAVASELAAHTASDVARWVRAHLDPLERAETLIDCVSAVPAEGEGDVANLTLAGAREMVRSAQVAQSVTGDFESRRVVDRRVLGPWYAGLNTDCGRLSATMPESADGFDAMRELLKHAESWAGHMPADVEQVLGRYASIDDYGTKALADALTAAQVIVRGAPDAIADPARRTRLCGALADSSPARPDLVSKGDRIAMSLDTWGERTAEHGATTPLQALPFESSIDWMRAHKEPFQHALTFTSTVSRVIGAETKINLAQARRTADIVRKARQAQESLVIEDERWEALLGDLYTGITTDSDRLDDAVGWTRSVRRAADIRNYRLGHTGNRSTEGLPPISAATAEGIRTLPAETSFVSDRAEWNRLRHVFAACFDDQHRGLAEQRLLLSLADATHWLRDLADNADGPGAWRRYADANDALVELGLGGVSESVGQEGMPVAELAPIMEKAILTAWVNLHLERDQRLSPTRADDRDRLVGRFRDGDRALIRNAPAKVIAEVNKARPANVTIGAAAAIRREAEKKSRHKPVRQMLDECGEVVRRIKPCFMMSPLTVSQFLPPGFRFDVVIFDEASQVLPEDAANSLYRAGSLIVAGDQKQLPPTSFFSVTGDAGDDEWSEDGVDKFESVLDLCKGSGVLRGLPLRWHYRSRHEDLIAFSNHEFYGDSMVTFPGVYESGPDIGVEFFKSDGVYDRGGRRDNLGEAALVAERVIHHVQTRPHLTIGVVALSKAQAEAIETAVAAARARRPDLEQFFNDDRLDGFFVKNLESVQGDERDVIILSIGYGPDANGKLTANFGPINNDAGWRRLNVAVTRARQRVELVASFYGGELPDTTKKGIWHLKRYLQFAEAGSQMLAIAETEPGRQFDGPFEQDVAEVLRGWGYDVVPQVGVAGYRIDVAVRHPHHPGVFALGIECDGAMYHSTRAARDRDRLREEVMSNLGWSIHRIWATDWHCDRGGALERLRHAVEVAIARDPYQVHATEETAEESGPTPMIAEPLVETTSADVEFARVGLPWVTEYDCFTSPELFDLRSSLAAQHGLWDVPLQDKDANALIGEVARAVVQREGPIELELLISRVRDAWGYAKAGSVVRGRIHAVLASEVASETLTCDSTAYSIPGSCIELVRGPSPSLARTVGLIPAVERKLAFTNIIRGGYGVRRDELIREVARVFGWSRVGQGIRPTLERDLDDLIAAGVLVQGNDGISAV
jgi:very-short-patch-repair endonuclease